MYFSSTLVACLKILILKVNLGFHKFVFSFLSFQCHFLIENYEEVIENWFFKTDHSRELSEYLCVDRVLSKEEAGGICSS